MPDVDAVPGAGVVLVVLFVALDEPVVGLVVDATEADGRAEMVALGGVVVDHVEDHLDVRVVERLDHGLELGHGVAGLLRERVLVVRRQEAVTVVAPVVAQSQVDEPLVLHELVHRHQFDGGHAEVGEVVDDGRVAHARVRAPHLGGDLRVGGGHALDVRLVDHRVVVLVAGRAVVAPVEVRVDHHGGHGVPEGVLGVALLRIVEVVAVQAGVAVKGTAERLAVRVEQQFGRVAAQAVLGLVGAVDAVAVALTGRHAQEVAVPDTAVDLGQFDATLHPSLVDEAELDPVGDLGEQREVGAGPVVGRAERVCGPGPGSDELRRGLRHVVLGHVVLSHVVLGHEAQG